MLYTSAVFVEIAVGEVQARNVHPTLNHLRQGFYIVTSRTDSGNDFSFPEWGLD
jgi:hypothetical protein